MKARIKKFRQHIQRVYKEAPTGCGSGFDEILCYELHSEPVNPRMESKTATGFETGLTFKELAQKWGISTKFLGELIADHCGKLQGGNGDE